jgi:hypothetical protein
MESSQKLKQKVTTEKQHSKWGIPVEQLIKYVLSRKGELAVAATYICTVSTFIVAYIHPTRSVLVTIDDFNEANLEIILMLLSMPSVFRFLADGLLGERRGLPKSPPEHVYAPWSIVENGPGGLLPLPKDSQASLKGLISTAADETRPWVT